MQPSDKKSSEKAQKFGAGAGCSSEERAAPSAKIESGVSSGSKNEKADASAESAQIKIIVLGSDKVRPSDKILEL